MKSTAFRSSLISVLSVATVGALLAPAYSVAQSLVPANISGTVTSRATGAGLAGRTVTATCSYGIFGSASYSAITAAGGTYTMAAAGLPAGSNCVVKVSPCSGSNPIQRTVNIPPDKSGVNFSCSS
ncbi:MAG: hypothetical protein SF066_03640 [Thermoanaerobaculia bacterium]|nr:hypothetical protein [Thermoanaerobaculia bacterium]